MRFQRLRLGFEIKLVLHFLLYAVVRILKQKITKKITIMATENELNNKPLSYNVQFIESKMINTSVSNNIVTSVRLSHVIHCLRRSIIQ